MGESIFTVRPGLPERLAIDINIVQRYQQTYPTKKQVGVEMFQLLRSSGQAFSHVILYFEHSVSRPDWAWLPLETANVRAAVSDQEWRVESDRPFGISWPRPVRVDGRDWPATDDVTVGLPAGTSPPIRLLRLTGDLLYSRVTEQDIAFRYTSSSRTARRHPRGCTAREPADPGRQKPLGIILLRGHHHVQVRRDGLLR